ncbi:phage antirepressor KilAC domain-containing protein [Staphylococcus haemolyticus]|uniref:phage antirepressor KilAC domain-containing protein n=1 Tax=Staphylococcus haemolyticus TaxID=1283 RepID=UPI001F0A1FA2|nr:phage antirepressor KilAC domain-containing protein [Staphylococcus haemolyticus]MCH4482897.1 phage antirepressor KilAC domain-containing protein [Staphylococcus haemolyticus]
MTNNNFNIEVFEDKGVLYTNSREVAKMIGVEHRTLKRDIKTHINHLDFDENNMRTNLYTSQKYFIDSEYYDVYNRKQHEYLITKIGCDFIANKMTGRKGALFTDAYITAFENMKKELQQLSQPVASYMIDDPIKRAEKWIEEYREKEQLIEENRSHLRLIESQKPKVLFAETLAGSEKSILISELAKLISQNGYKIGPNKLFEWLRKNGYLTKRKGESWNLPTQKGMNLGVFEIKKGVRQHADGSPQVTRTTKVTPKGQEYFINKFLGQQHQLSFGGQL